MQSWICYATDYWRVQFELEIYSFPWNIIEVTLLFKGYLFDLNTV